MLQLRTDWLRRIGARGFDFPARNPHETVRKRREITVKRHETVRNCREITIKRREMVRKRRKITVSSLKTPIFVQNGHNPDTGVPKVCHRLRTQPFGRDTSLVTQITRISTDSIRAHP